MGIDADVYLDIAPPHPRLPVAEREDIEPASLVRPDGMASSRRAGARACRTPEAAATLPGVDRILVNPAIKRQLCTEVTGDRAWLRLIRPWWGHASHMHIHFAAPPTSPSVRNRHRHPPGDSCDASLQWWFDQIKAPPKPVPPGPPHKPPALPVACRAIMAAPG